LMRRFSFEPLVEKINYKTSEINPKLIFYLILQPSSFYLYSLKIIQISIKDLTMFTSIHSLVVSPG
jgi:hypothetical protein